MALYAAGAMALPAQFTTLYSFPGDAGTEAGAGPTAGMIQGANGNLYGATYGQEYALEPNFIYEMTPGGVVTTLYTFCSTCQEGGGVPGALVQIQPNGDLYGTTTSGGSNGAGTVFMITPGGALTTLYNFCSESGCTDGGTPLNGLVQATNGYLYGTTSTGGANGNGTIFKITPAGALTTLYSFCAVSGCTDGNTVLGNLIQATNGNLYGTTLDGGLNSGGTIFKITPAGVFTTLYRFCAASSTCPDGQGPIGLMQATNGNFYGVTQGGGTGGGTAPCTLFFGIPCGTVFEFTTGGTLTTIYNFCSLPNCSDGAQPYTQLIQATDGYLYGTNTAAGPLTGAGGGSPRRGSARYGASGGPGSDGGITPMYPGTIFKISTSGVLTMLDNFCVYPDSSCGAVPVAPLVQATNGTLYGTTTQGGSGECYTLDWNGCGVVFSLAVGLGPFVETRPTIGEAGKVVKILGTDLTGTTSVKFNGTAAAFSVVKPTLISTTVPAGATSGTVEVVTPSGTLRSNVRFVVP
jgi:uncharacterized repeat protein (TIGR03803 family)